METTVEQLIKDRTFDSLTGEELGMVKELCETEEEFQTMKQFFRELDAVTASDKTVINPEVKKSLDGIFNAKYPGLHNNWTAPEAVPAPAPVIPLYQRTWVRVAAVALIVLGTVPFWNFLKTDTPVQEKQLTAKLEQPKPISSEEKKTNGTTATQPVIENTQQFKYKAISPGAVMADETGVDGFSGSWSAEAPAFADSESESRTAFYETTVSGTAFTWSAPLTVASNKFTTMSNSQKGFGAVSSFGFTTSDTNSFANLSVGRKADLFPNRAMGEMAAINAISMDEEPDDLLDLLVPAF